MTLQQTIDKIYETHQVVRADGVARDVGKTSISKEEGQFIQKIVEGHRLSNSVEIGCAFGLSSLFICSGLSHAESPRHTIIDPFQSSQWGGIGVHNLKKSGVDFFDLIEEKSEIALPQLLSENRSFDFGFIDGWHTLDHTLIDFFYLDRMLSVGGVIVIDDVTYPGINKLAGYLSQYPHYEVIGTVNIWSPRRMMEMILTLPLRVIALCLPSAIATRIFSGYLAQKRRKFRLNTSMIALKKIKKDERTYDWYAPF